MRLFTRTLTLGLTATLVFALAANASASRRASLHGNVLLEDVTDVFVFPQLALDYRNLVRFSMGADSATGDGQLIFGTDEMAFGVVAHRSDNTGPYNGLMVPAEAHTALLEGALSFGVLSSTWDAPATIVDLLLSMKMGEDANLGFRLGLAHAGTSNSTGGVDVSDGQTSLLLTGGYSTFSEDGMDMDLALNLAIGLGSDDNGAGAETSGNDINVNLDGRFYLPMADMVELGVLGHLGLSFGGITTATGGVEASNSVFGLDVSAGAGPVYKLEKARIAAYGVLAFGTITTDPDVDADNDAITDTAIVVPGLRMAAEVDLTDWFQFRAGLNYAWIIAGNSDENDTSSSSTGGSFGWSAGFGLVFDKFRADVALQNNWLTNSPAFLGTEGPLASTVSASYSF
ncbi:MAG: hypothetical protein CSA66_00775 [Proteobacteria bacterium]|nr:MAG: hypothetical protein CSA66_00775 [Pseudomonadota bacterium]